MADTLGPVPIPDPPTIPAFPLRPTYGGGLDYNPPIAIHTFESPELKTEQRFLLGSGAKRFRVRVDRLACNDYDRLKTHWAQAKGQYAQFPYAHPVPGGTVENYTVRYENPLLTLEQLVGLVLGDPGITLLEVPQSTPDYTSTHTVDRFPDIALTAALREQAHRLIPLVALAPRDGSDMVYLSNQRFRLDGHLFLPRLTEWGGISQTLDEASDAASFTFGNADQIWDQYVNQVNLQRAGIEFALFHVDSGYIVKLWAGYALAWQFDGAGHFTLPASDGVFQLGMGYPYRTLSRTCWKVYKGRFCPSTSSETSCPKSWEACQARGVPHSFGGVIVPGQRIRVADNSTGVHGWGRSSMTSVTIVQDTVYERPVQEVYTDTPMKVTCDVAGGRDESEFYSALGIVGEGPISGYASNLLAHSLDGQPPHDPLHGGGWRAAAGNDPAPNQDYFGISQAPWGSIPPGSTYAAGMAFAEIRRTDEKGLQLSQVADRNMQVTVTGGIGGWVWTAPGARVYTPALANVVWVAVNVYLRGIGLRVDQSNASLVPAETMEQFFDVQQAIDMAAICDKEVDKLIGPGKERQYPFRGVLKEKKPLKDWIQEILNCALGYYTFVNGKLWIGLRFHSGVVAGNAFSQATILYKSLRAAPLQPRFNWLVGQFGDEEFEYQLNSVTVYDMDAAALAGTADSPQYQQSTMTFVGVSNKSQAARLISTRLREELGGVGVAEQRAARNLQFRTTILALKIQVGDIISLTHSQLPNGYAEARVTHWILNPDFSIDIQATATTDAMYDLTAGPKPVDVPADPIPPGLLPSPAGLAWMPDEEAPEDGDPLYPIPQERSFALWQDYNITREGIWGPAIWVRGKAVINNFAALVQPRILGAELVDGGYLEGPVTVYIAVTQRDLAGTPTVPSNLWGVWIPAGVRAKQLRLTLDVAAGVWAGWDWYTGYDRRQIAWQGGQDGALPATLDFPGPVVPMTRELPEAAARRIRIAAKHVWHSGVAGVLVTGVPAANQLQANDFIGSTDNWVGRILSALADESDGRAPLWNFKITAFQSSTGTFTVTPNCIRGAAEDSVEVGDVLIMRSIGQTASATQVTDLLWNNSVALAQFDSPGLRPDEEVGRIARVLRGTGQGQFRHIMANTAVTITVDPPWDTIPDSTSIIIIEAPDYMYAAESSEFEAQRSDVAVEIRLPVENLADRVALVAGYLVDDQGRWTDEQFAVFREIYIFGQPPTVRIVGPEKLDPNRQPDPGPWLVVATDHTIRADTSENDVEVELSPLYVYEGRTLYLVNDNGPNDLIVHCAPGETLFDGASTLTLHTRETARVTAG